MRRVAWTPPPREELTMRKGSWRLAAVGVGLSIALVGCSGGGGGGTAGPGSTPGGASVAPSAGASAEPSAGGAGSPEPSAAPSSGGGGGTAEGVCDLVSAAELGDILGAPVTTTVIPGPPDTCDIQIDGAPVAAMVLQRSDPSIGMRADFIFDAYASDPSSSEVPGIGERALHNEGMGLLLILKNDAVVSVTVYDDRWSADEQLELKKQIGEVAAGRM
jgi:hypothetical protein